MLNKFTSILLVLVLYGSVTNGQETDEVVLKRIADGIITETTFGFKNKQTGKITYDPNKLLSTELYYVNPYNEWRYWNGVLGLAMQSLSSYTRNSKYLEFARKNIQFCFDNNKLLKKMTEAGNLKGMEQFYKHELLDDCGAMAANLTEIYKTDPREDYKAYLDKTADYMLYKEHTLDDGTLARTWPEDKTVWLDDMYMSVPFLARYATITKEAKYFDFASKQVQLFTKHLFDKKSSLYFHCYYDSIHQNGPACWGRANGWSIMAQTELLALLPKNHPDRENLLRIYRQQIAGFSKYQGSTGLWHQLLNKENSFFETSVSAMFTYAVAYGINNGLLDTAYAEVALSGWSGIKTMITPEGKVKNICKGTGTSTSLKYYYDRPTPLNDIHGLGPVLLAGIEVMKLKNKLNKDTN